MDKRTRSEVNDWIRELRQKINTFERRKTLSHFSQVQWAFSELQNVLYPYPEPPEPPAPM